MKNNKLLLTSILAFLITGLPLQVLGMEKDNEKDNTDLLPSPPSIISAQDYYTQHIKPLGDNNNAVRYWSSKKANNEAEAEYMLASIFFYDRLGDGPDYAKAEFWAEKFALHHSQDGEYLLGLIYLKGGYGVEKNLELAKCIFLKLAQLGYSLAADKCKEVETEIEFERSPPHKEQHTNIIPASVLKEVDPVILCNRGNDYYCGNGVARDFEQARQYYEKSAAQNNPDAQFMLGAMNFYGIGIPRDEKKGIEYYEQAKEQKHLGAIDSIEAIENILKFRSQTLSGYLPRGLAIF